MRPSLDFFGLSPLSQGPRNHDRRTGSRVAVGRVRMLTMLGGQGIQPVIVAFNNAKNCFLHLPPALVSQLSLQEVCYGVLWFYCSLVTC